MTVNGEDFKSDIKELERQISDAWNIRRTNPLEALRLSIDAIQLSSKLDSQKHLALAHRNTGTAFYLISQYTTGLEHLLKAKKLFELENDKKGLADVLRNMGNIHHSTNQYEDAYDLYLEAKKLCIEINDKQGEAYNLGNIGYVKILQNKFDDAIIYINRAIEILEEIKDTLGFSDALNNLGKAYLGKYDLPKALELFLLSLQKSKEIEHLRGITNGYISLGNYYFKEQNYELTQKYLFDALAASEKLGEVALIISVNKQLSDMFEAKREYQKALNYYRRYEQLKSDNEKEDHKKLINSLKYQFSFEQLELEKSILEQKNHELSIANKLINDKNIQLELLSLVAKHTDNIIIIYDEDFRLEWLNNSFIKYTGAEYSNYILNNKPSIFEMSGNSSIKKIVEECILKKEPIKYNSSFINEQNKIRWFSSTLSPIFDEAGTLKKLVIIDADITEIKLTGEILNQKNKDITDSINYALRIQSSLLPSHTIFEKLFSNYFIYYTLPPRIPYYNALFGKQLPLV
jgi:PAS domain S-box-containing protein